MPRVILMGAPGAGKGTQGEILATAWNVPRIAPGDIFRLEIKNESELGKLVKSYSDSGKLVPDQVVIEMMRSRLSQPDAKSGWILDGFPRTLPQAEALNLLLAEIDQKYDRVINIDVPEPNLLERLKMRADQQNRVDDTEAVISQRLKEYYEKTQPLLDFYGDSVVQVDGIPSLDIVTASINACFTCIV
jgi:adenylate kinase